MVKQKLTGVKPQSPTIPHMTLFLEQQLARFLTRIDQFVPDKDYRPPRKKTLSAYLIKIARLGGCLACASDPPPGTTVMWRGHSRLTGIKSGAMLGARFVGNLKPARSGEGRLLRARGVASPAAGGIGTGEGASKLSPRRARRTRRKGLGRKAPEACPDPPSPRLLQTVPSFVFSQLGCTPCAPLLLFVSFVPFVVQPF